MKLLPCTGFYPNDAVCYPICETVQSLGIPIVMHTGHGDVSASSSNTCPLLPREARLAPLTKRGRGLLRIFWSTPGEDKTMALIFELLLKR